VTFRDSNGEASRRRSILLIAAVSLALIVVAVLAVAVYDLGGLRTRAVNNVSEGYSDVVFRNMRENCIKGANDSVRKSGGDPSVPEVAHKLADYCDCFVAGARTEFKVAEIADLEKDPDRIASNPRVKAIIDRCLAQYIKS
jgi:hypothetical protein